jgi:DnaJ like chaperone protein
LFKLIGALIGYFYFGIFGAFFGYFVGSIIDRYRAYGVGGVNPFSASQRQAVFLETVFILMGKVAKADGRVSQNEIAHVELFIEKLGMSAEHRQQAIVLFKRGTAPDFDLAPTLRQFMAVCGQTHGFV